MLMLGCSRSSSPPDAVQNLPSRDAESPALRLHWLGKNRLAGEANATNFMAIWKMPESEKLESQTLDKLSTAPWRLLPKATPLTNAPVALLRPLLDDLVQAESYLEVQNATNGPDELVLAIRLETTRARLWQTNFPVILDSLKSIQPNSFALSRAGEWTLVSLTCDERGRSTGSTLMDEFKSRILRDGAPFSASKSNYWVEAKVEARSLADALQLDWKLPATFPHINMVVSGDGENVRTRAELDFPKPLGDILPPWRVPFHLTAEPVIGLTATRGVSTLLQQLGIFSAGQSSLFPDQLLVWLRSGPPLQIYFALPTNDSDVDFLRIAPAAAKWINAHAEAKVYGAVAMETDRGEFRWNGLSLCAPFLARGTNDGQEFLHGGFGYPPVANVRLPIQLHQHIVQATNLIFIEWELTSHTLPQWRYLDDAARMIFDESHVSRLGAHRESINWLLATMTNLSHSVTELRASSPSQIVFTRKSTLGLNAVELDVLLNWIVLPEFPQGMSSFWRTNPIPFKPKRLTNTPSARLR